MVGIVRAGLDFAYNIAAPSRATGWKTWLLHAYCMHVLKQDQGKDEAVIPTLQLGRGSSRLMPLVTGMYPEEVSKQAQARPVYTLMWAQRKSLIKKLCAAAAFYAVRDVSLCDALSRLTSHSTRVSRTIEPILNRVTMPVYLIALAPVILKLMHISLIYLDPKNTHWALNKAKIIVDKTSQNLESLWHLYASLSYLATSRTAGRSCAFLACHLYCAPRLIGRIHHILDQQSPGPWIVVFKFMASCTPLMLMPLVGCDIYSLTRTISHWDRMRDTWNSSSSLDETVLLGLLGKVHFKVQHPSSLSGQLTCGIEQAEARGQIGALTAAHLKAAISSEMPRGPAQGATYMSAASWAHA